MIHPLNTSMLAAITTFGLLTSTILAAPSHLLPRADPTQQLLSIAPNAASCANAPYPSECATASEAVAPLISSFTTYSITTAAEQAALLSWMAYESADFKYNQNHFPAPGVPGQGTRTMMSVSNVAKYVASIPALASKANGLDPAAILALVQPDQYSFASAAWFYSTTCPPSIKQGVQSGTQAGWTAFISQCVGTSANEGSGSTSRLAYWQRAMAALSAA